MSDAVWPPFVFLSFTACVSVFVILRRAGASASQTAPVLTLLHALAQISWAVVAVFQKNEACGVSTPVQISLMAGSLGYYLYDVMVSVSLVPDVIKVVHRLTCIAGLLEVLISGFCGKAICVNMIVLQISTPFLFLLKSGLIFPGSPRYRWLNRGYAALVVVTRLGVAPFLARALILEPRASFMIKGSSAVLALLSLLRVVRLFGKEKI